MSKIKRSGRIVVVTGGGSGMGRAIARRFADNQDVVYILGRTESKLRETAQTSTHIKPVVCDVTDVASITAAVQQIAKEHEVIDVLVNCAGGVAWEVPEADLTEAHASWENIIGTNLTSVFMMTFAFLAYLRRPSGRIINITSVAALGGSSARGVSGQAYSAAKAGIHGMSRTLANTLASEGITVNCLAPGVTDHTAFFGGEGVPEERASLYKAKIPVGRLGLPEEMAAGVFYLASPEAAFITGEIMNINGGQQFGR